MNNFLHVHLTDDRKLVLHRGLGILTLLAGETILAQETFAPVETTVLLQLMEAWPAYATNSALYAAYHQASETAAHRVVMQATEERRLNIMLHSVRNVIARIRARLVKLEIGIEAEHGLGYKLVDKQSGPGSHQSTSRARRCDSHVLSSA